MGGYINALFMRVILCVMMHTGCKDAEKAFLPDYYGSYAGLTFGFGHVAAS